MFRLNKILTYLSNVVKNSFKSVIDFVDNLKSSTIDRLLVMKKILLAILGLLTTTAHHKLTKSIQNSCNSEPNTI